MPTIIRKVKINNLTYWTKDGKRWAGRAKENGKWYHFGTDGTKTLIGNNKFDFSNIKTTNNRRYSPSNLNKIAVKLENIPLNLRASILGNVIDESGGYPNATSEGKKFYGILLWGKDRYPGEKLDEQINYLSNTLNNVSDLKSWTHGGKGSGYNSGMLAYNLFIHSKDLEKTNKAFTLGYVRPTGKHFSANNRYKIAKQLIPRLYTVLDSINNKLLPSYVLLKQQGGLIPKALLGWIARKLKSVVTPLTTIVKNQTL